MHTRIRGSAAALGAMVGGASALAVPTVYYSEDRNLSPTAETVPLAAWPHATAKSIDFGSHITNRQIFSFETSEGVTANTQSPAPPPPATGVNPMVTFDNGITATFTNGVVRAQAPGTANAGRFPTTGGQYLATTFGAGPAVDLRIDFSQPVNAFGFFATDIGDPGSRLHLTTSGGLEMDFAIPHSGGGFNGTVSFCGIIDPDTTFTSVRFSAPNNPEGDVFGFDDFTISNSVVPAPGGAALLAAVAACLAPARRRRS